MTDAEMLMPECPECGAAVYVDWTCHTYGPPWMACVGCDSALYYGCDSEWEKGCRWGYTHGLNPRNPRADRNEAKRPPWIAEGSEPTSGALGILVPVEGVRWLGA